MGQNANSAFLARGPGSGGRHQTQATTDGAGNLAVSSLNTPATFTGTNVAAAAGVVTTVALATTYTGLCLSNPAGSGKNLILRRASASQSVAPSTITTIGLIAGFAAGGVTVHTTPAPAPKSALIGDATVTGVAKLDAAATLVGTPYWADILGTSATATTSVSVSRTYDGEIVIPPGGYVAIGTSIASPALGIMASFLWDEVDA